MLDTRTKYPALARLLALPAPRQVCDDLVGLLLQPIQIDFVSVDEVQIAADVRYGRGLGLRTQSLALLLIVLFIKVLQTLI